MPGIAGIVNRDGAPCERARIDALAKTIAFRGAAAVSVFVDGPVGLATLASRASSAMDTVPPRTHGSRYEAAFDGRIDNCEALARHLGTGAHPHAMRGADLMLALFERHGDDAFARIEGDFAVAIWDRKTRTLTCARDTWGVRPFVYCELGRSFVFASELTAFRAIPGFAPEPDEAMVAEHLAIDIRSGGRTLYRGVKRLEPAHVLTVEPDRSTMRRYWSYDTTRALHFGSDEEYAEAFFDVFTSSVRARLDVGCSTGCELSGGLDSSSVTGIAQRLTPGRVESFSLVFPGLECDESEYMDAVCEESGVRSNRVSPASRSACELLAEAFDLNDAADLPNGAMHRAVYERATERGIRVVLTGIGGDDWFQGSRPSGLIAELLSEGRMLEAMRGRSATEIAAAIRLLLAESPLGPTVRSARKWLRGQSPALEKPPWMGGELWGRSGTAELLASDPPPLRGSPARIATLRVGEMAWQVWGVERAERLAARRGVELRHPFLDRRVRELGLALPESQRVRDGVTRVVVRNALRGILPELVRLRRSKAFFTPVMLAGMRATGLGELLGNLSIEQRGWVDGAWIRSRWKEVCENRPHEEDVGFGHWAILMTLSLEAWHRQFFG